MKRVVRSQGAGSGTSENGGRYGGTVGGDDSGSFK
jgi:hypothetical protein